MYEIILMKILLWWGRVLQPSSLVVQNRTFSKMFSCCGHYPTNNDGWQCTICVANLSGDSSMWTFAYSWKPWVSEQNLGSAKAILEYLNEAIDENDIRRHIRLQTNVKSASFSSKTALWKLNIVRTPGTTSMPISCKFLLMTTGYYNYDTPYTPGMDNLWFCPPSLKLRINITPESKIQSFNWRPGLDLYFNVAGRTVYYSLYSHMWGTFQD